MSIAVSEHAPSLAGPDLHTLQLDVDDDGIAVIRMDLPDRPMNVTTPELTAELMLAFQRVATDDGIRGAILTSGKPGCFVAGGDIKDFVNAYDRGMTRAQAFELSRESSDFFRRIETCGKPVAAAINGLALGGGLELCLCCHYRVIVDDPKAIVGQPEVTIGLLPGGGGTQRLPRLIGIEKALPLLLTGRHVKPREALALGLVDAVVPRDELISSAKRWLLAHPQAKQPWDVKGYALPGGTAALANASFMAGQFAEGGGHNYPAPQAILSCVLEGVPVPIEAGLRIESTWFSTLLTGPVARNLMRTTFVNKGLADKLARRPSGVPKAAIKRLGIAGKGTAAIQLADAARTSDIDTVLFDGIPDHADCDLLVHPLPVGDLAAASHACSRSGIDVVGIHLSGTARARVMEIVVDGNTGERALARAFDLARQLRHTPVAVHGGLYTHRLRTAYVDEGMCLLAEGVAPALIEDAAAMAGMDCGPLAFADDMPLEAHWRRIRDIVECAEESARPVAVYHVGKRMVQRFLRLGRIAGAGFYDYAEQGRKTLWPGLTDVFPSREKQPDAEQVKIRLLHAQAMEAARCIEEGLIRDVADADVAGVFGCGFPSYTGGPVSLIDTAGIQRFVSVCEALATRHGARFQPSPWLKARAERGEPFYARDGAAS